MVSFSDPIVLRQPCPLVNRQPDDRSWRAALNVLYGGLVFRLHRFLTSRTAFMSSTAGQYDFGAG
jgi:hypothetical protein